MDAFFADRVDGKGVCLEARPIEPFHSVHLATPGDGTGQNCAERTLFALCLAPEVRAVIGTLLVIGVRCAVCDDGIRICKPWGHHMWLTDGDRGFHDPNLQNLSAWAERERLLLPRPLEEMDALIVADPAEQLQVIRGVLRGVGDWCDPCWDLIYLPGLVFRSDLEDRPVSLQYVHAWGQLASECCRDGGWSEAQLEAALGRVEELLLEDPRPYIKSAQLDSPRPLRRGGDGFGGQG